MKLVKLSNKWTGVLSGLSSGCFWAAVGIKHLVCAQIPNVCAKNTRGTAAWVFFVSNQNRGCDRNLWKSLSVPAWIALGSCVNNKCVTPKRCDILRVRHAMEKKRERSFWRALVVAWKRCPVTESVTEIVLIKDNAVPTVSPVSYPLKVIWGV